MSKQHIEVEGGELAIRNSHGDIAIIPKADKEKVQKMIDAGCNTCIDRYVNKLPRLQHYAADGTLYHIPDTLSDDPPNSNNVSKDDYAPFDLELTTANLSIATDADIATISRYKDNFNPNVIPDETKAIIAKYNATPIKSSTKNYKAPSNNFPYRIYKNEDEARSYFYNTFYDENNKSLITLQRNGVFQCLGSSKKAAALANPYDGIGWYGLETKYNIGNPKYNLSKLGIGKEYEIYNNGTIDTWEYAIAAVKSGAASYKYNVNDGDDPTKLKKLLTSGELPIGTLIQKGDLNKSSYGKAYNMRLPRHTVTVVGYIDNGDSTYNAILFDLGSYKTANDLDLNSVVFAISQNYNDNTTTGMKNKYNTRQESLANKENVNFISGEQISNEITKYANNNNLDVTDMYKTSIASIINTFNNNISYISDELNLSPDGYNELINMTVALTMQESATVNRIGKIIDNALGSSTGTAQILNDNKKLLREKYHHLYNKLKDENEEAFYIATLFAENIKLMDYYFQKGVYKPNVIEERNPSFEGNATVNKIINKIQDKVSTNNVTYSRRHTTGNNPQLEDWEKLAYIWNSPSRLVLGDAQGKEENTYVKNVGKYREIVTNINKQ